MDKLVSIIVPVYNKQETIVKCLNSLARISYEKLEIIIVDDGSTDKSSELCQKQCIKNKKFKYFRKDNGGVSSARNYGIKKANGDFIFFVDADDSVSSDIISESLRCLCENDCLVFSCYSEYLDGNVIDSSLCKTYLIDDFFDVFFNKYNSYVMNTPWNKVYRSRIIIENDLKFDESLNLGEDLCFNIDYYLHCNNVKIINTQLYFYSYSESGLTNCKRNVLDLWKSEYKSLKKIKKITTVLNKIDSGVINNYIMIRIKKVLSIYLDKCNFKESIELRKVVLKNIKSISMCKIGSILANLKIYIYIFLLPEIYLKNRMKRG